MKIGVLHEYKYIFLNKLVKLKQWYHTCLIVKHASNYSSLELYFQGILLKEVQLNLKTKAVPTECTLCYANLTKLPNSKLSGSLSHFNIWNRALFQKEVRCIHSCTCKIEGNIVNWLPEGNQISDSAVIEDIDSSILCKEHETTKKQLIFPDMKFPESKHLCVGINGEIETPKTHNQIDSLYSIGEKEAPSCRLYWVGINDEVKEDFWHSTHTGKWLSKSYFLYLRSF